MNRSFALLVSVLLGVSLATAFAPDCGGVVGKQCPTGSYCNRTQGSSAGHCTQYPADLVRTCGIENIIFVSGVPVCPFPTCGPSAPVKCPAEKTCRIPSGSKLGWCITPPHDLVQKCGLNNIRFDKEGKAYCIPPNCGGFVGKQCPAGQSCKHPSGSSAGWCF